MRLNMPQEQPPQPGLTGDAPDDVAPGVANAAQAQVQVRFLSPNQCNVLRSLVVWVHDVCIRVSCPDLYSFVLCLHRFAIFQYMTTSFVFTSGRLRGYSSVPVMLLSIEKGKLSTPYTLSQDRVIVFGGWRDAGLGRCKGYFYNFPRPG
jgi:hypothetical protein